MRPRILFLVPSDYGALERKGVSRTILERDEHGFFERVVTVHPIATRSRVIDLNGVHRLIEFDAGRALDAGTAWWRRLRAAAGALFLLPRIARLIVRERITLVRANDPYLMGVLGWACARLTGRRLCVSIHADYDKNFALTPKRGLMVALRRLSLWSPRFVFRRADLVLPIRRHLGQWAERHGAPPDRICIIPHGIDLAPYAALSPDVLASLAIPDGAPIVSVVGRLSRYNYVYDVMAAARAVLAQVPDAIFVLMGDGEEREPIGRQIAQDPILARGVRLLGSRPYDEVVALRRASAVSLCPMGGFSLIEACAAGSAVITYDVDWHGEIISDGMTGLLVAENDAVGLGAAVVKLLGDAGLRDALGTAARRFVQEHHDEHVTSSIKQRCYMRLLRGSAG